MKLYGSDSIIVEIIISLIWGTTAITGLWVGYNILISFLN